MWSAPWSPQRKPLSGFRIHNSPLLAIHRGWVFVLAHHSDAFHKTSQNSSGGGGNLTMVLLIITTLIILTKTGERCSAVYRNSRMWLISNWWVICSVSNLFFSMFIAMFVKMLDLQISRSRGGNFFFFVKVVPIGTPPQNLHPSENQRKKNIFPSSVDTIKAPLNRTPPYVSRTSVSLSPRRPEAYSTGMQEIASKLFSRHQSLTRYLLRT